MLNISLAVNPLSPKSDQHEISPYNVNALENRLVMRIEFMTREDEGSFRSEFTANLYLLEVTRQVFCVTFEVYDVRFQRGELDFHVCHLPESF